MPPRKGRTAVKKVSKVENADKLNPDELEKMDLDKVTQDESSPVKSLDANQENLNTASTSDNSEPNVFEVKPPLNTELENPVDTNAISNDVTSDEVDTNTNTMTDTVNATPNSVDNMDNTNTMDNNYNVNSVDTLNNVNGVDTVDEVNMDVDMEDYAQDLSMSNIPPPPDSDGYGFEDQISSEEIAECLSEIIDSLMDLSKQLEDQDDEEEEGAIREEEVPFERVPEEVNMGNVLLFLNLPPEFDTKRLTETLTKYPTLISNVSFLDKTKLKVFFTSYKGAQETKTKLDSVKLYNRRLQVIFAPDKYTINAPKYLNIPLNLSNNRHGSVNHHHNFVNHQNYPSQQNQFRGFGSNSVIPPPPSVPYTGPPQERFKISFNRYKLVNTTMSQLLTQIFNEGNFEPGSQSLQWDDSSTFYQNQLKFDKLFEKFGLTTRYVMVGKLNDSVFENSTTVHDFLSNFTNSSYTYEIVTLPSSYLSSVTHSGTNTNNTNGVERVENGFNTNSTTNVNSTDDEKWLYVVFDKNRDGLNFYNKVCGYVSGGNSETPNGEAKRKLLVRYACPLGSLDSLWIGNVCEFCGYFRNEDEVYSFFNNLGNLKHFKLVYESNCIFLTFQSKQTSVKVYNLLNALSPRMVIRLLTSTSSNGSSNGSSSLVERFCTLTTDVDNDSMGLMKEDLVSVDFTVSKSENSFALGQKLLNAIKRRTDSQELIEKLLNTNDVSSILSENSISNRRTHGSYGSYGSYAPRRRERSRYDRRPYRDEYGREPYREKDRNSREHNKYRQRYPISKESRVDRFGRTIRTYDKSRRDEPWKYNYHSGDSDNNLQDKMDPEARKRSKERGRDPNYNDTPKTSHLNEPYLSDQPVLDQVEMDIDRSDSPSTSSVSGGKYGKKLDYCQLLKRGKFICRVGCEFVRGDRAHKLPELLDVNQRANPERLKNYLTKSAELSLWKLSADCKEDNQKYDSLCEYLISKNRVALVQQGPYEIYIVPPQEQYIQMLNTPDSQFMYAYVLSKS
uniref:Spen paralogue and orthologue SPOC C-terminal domain-containing protein n=1 Tax=Theileria annulata TaxID=5874 RepID=A0A3B0MIC5_THEAN